MTATIILIRNQDCSALGTNRSIFLVECLRSPFSSKRLFMLTFLKKIFWKVVVILNLENFVDGKTKDCWNSPLFIKMNFKLYTHS